MNFTRWRGKRLFHLSGDKYFTKFRWRNKLRRRYFIKTLCSHCEGLLFADAANRKKAKSGRSFCSRSCTYAGNSGSNNCNWVGGRRRKRGIGKGHVLIYAPDHPNARKNYVAEHRLVVEKEIGRLLRADEFVHHIDCDPTNNSPDNLVVVDRWQHNLAHASIEGCIKALMTSGALTFNKEALRYEIAI